MHFLITLSRFWIHANSSALPDCVSGVSRNRGRVMGMAMTYDEEANYMTLLVKRSILKNDKDLPMRPNNPRTEPKI